MDSILSNSAIPVTIKQSYYGLPTEYTVTGLDAPARVRGFSVLYFAFASHMCVFLADSSLLVRNDNSGQWYLLTGPARNAFQVAASQSDCISGQQASQMMAERTLALFRSAPQRFMRIDTEPGQLPSLFFACKTFAGTSYGYEQPFCQHSDGGVMAFRIRGDDRHYSVVFTGGVWYLMQPDE